MRPLLFLDFDDVICLNRPYGGYDVACVNERPADLWEKLWHQPALALLEKVVREHSPQVVLTTSWLQFLQLEDAKAIFHQTGVPWLTQALHAQGEALQPRGGTRLEAIDAWRATHAAQEPYAILDDHLSGTGLAGSAHDLAGRLVMCDVEVGLLPQHLVALGRALSR